MKITKAIREYIEQMTRIKAEESIAELKNKAEEKKKNIEKDIKALEKECMPLVQKLVDKYPGCFTDRARAEFVGYRDYNMPEEKAYREASQNAYVKAKQAALEIIVEMELGGTMADLKEKLDNLKF